MRRNPETETGQLHLVPDPDHVQDPDPEARAVHLARTTTRTTRAPTPATSIARGRALVAVADPRTRRANQINQRIKLLNYVHVELHLLVYKVIKHLNIDNSFMN